MYGELCSYEPDSNDAVDSVVCKMKLASPAGFFAVSLSEPLRLEAIRALTAVSDMSNITSVPSVAKGNADSHAIGLGQMNLHGYLARERIFYGSEEGVDFTNMYFYPVTYHAIRASNQLAVERGKSFEGFENSKYASGEYFDKYTEAEWKPATPRVVELFETAGIHVPTQEDWLALKTAVMQGGLYNQNLQAVPPTGSISYINHSTSSIHPIVSKIEIRKEGKIGRVYYPAAFMTNDNLDYYQDAYEIGPEKIIDTYAAATQHVDQGLSLTLFFGDTATTRDINKAQIGVEEGHQDHLLHPPSPDGANRHGSAGLRLLRALISQVTK